MDQVEQTPAELFLASFRGGYDDDAPGAAVSALRLLGTQEVYELAAGYCRSEVPLHRARALQVLAQLGNRVPAEERPFFEDSVSIALHHLDDPDPSVIPPAAWALAHLKGDRAEDALIQLRHHPDPEVRWAVALGLGGSELAGAIPTLVELMEDSDDDVRDWATFGLGSLYASDPPDTPEIREAFRKRLDDPFKDARDEAVWALATRKDPQGLQLLIDRLSAKPHCRGDEDTAWEILDLSGDPPLAELVAGLRALLSSLSPSDGP